MHSGMHKGCTHKQSDSTVEESSGRWYFSRKEIKERPPFRSDAIDLKKETYLRKSYCTFLQDMGMILKVTCEQGMAQFQKKRDTVVIVLTEYKYISKDVLPTNQFSVTEYFSPMNEYNKTWPAVYFRMIFQQLLMPLKKKDAVFSTSLLACVQFLMVHLL